MEEELRHLAHRCPAARTQALCEITLELIRRNGFKQNIYVRPIAYKSAERIGVYPDDQDAFSVIAIPFGDYLPSEKGLHAVRDFVAPRGR